MSRKRVVILVVALLVVLAASATGFLVYTQVRQMRRMMEAMPRTDRESEAYGAAHTQMECLDEAQRRGEACEDALCRNASGFFVAPCVIAASPEPRLCDGVPTGKSWTSWAERECKGRAKRALEVCRSVQMSRSQYCAAPARRTAP